MNRLLIAVFIAGIITTSSFAFAQDAVVAAPSEVESHGMEQSVKVERDVVAGPAVPDAAELHTLPTQSDAYTYTVVNNRRVIIDAKTGKVVNVVKVTD
jgi:hypothetical protein